MTTAKPTKGFSHSQGFVLLGLTESEDRKAPVNSFQAIQSSLSVLMVLLKFLFSFFFPPVLTKRGFVPRAAKGEQRPGTRFEFLFWPPYEEDV